MFKLHPSRWLLILILIATGLTACQQYERKPLDLDAHRSAWALRDAAGADVAAFAAQLASQLAGRDAPDATGAADEFNPADGLSLAEAEIVALFFNPELRTARLRSRAAAASAKYAGLWDDPVFDVDVLRILKSVPDPWIVGTSLGFTIPISGRLEAERALAAAEHRAELARVAQREWEVVVELRARWIEWSATRLRAEAMAQVVDSVQQVIAAVDSLERAGELPLIQTRLLRIEAVTQASEAQALRGQSVELEVAVKSLLGLVPDAPIQLQSAVAMPSEELPSDDQHAAIAQRNPALAVFKAEYDAAEETLRREIRKQYPDLGIGPAYENEEDQSRIGLIASLPIPLLNRNRQGIAVAQAQREVARAAFEAEYERLVHQLARAEAQVRYLREVREQLEAALIPLVEEQARDARRLIELGEFDALMQLESLQRLVDATRRLIDAREAEAAAAAALQALLGPRIVQQPLHTQTPTQIPTQGTSP